MEIEGKDWMIWLHDVRKKMREEEKKSGLSSVEWMKKITDETEKILSKKNRKIELVPH